MTGGATFNTIAWALLNPPAREYFCLNCDAAVDPAKHDFERCRRMREEAELWRAIEEASRVV